MSTEQLKNAVANRNDKPLTFPVLLKQASAEIARALPRHLQGDRMERIALTAFRRNPALAKCHPKSVLAAVIQSAQLGLEPDTLGRSFLIPYGTECNFVPGWKGLVDLCNRSGNATVWTYPVYEGDILEYGLGTSPKVDHIPGNEFDENKITHAYAVGRVKGSDYPVIEIWPVAKIRKHRDKYNKQGNKHYSFREWEMYCRKVVLLQVLKYMPLSPELASAIALSDAAEIGAQHLNIDRAASNDWEGQIIDIAPETVNPETGEITTTAQQAPSGEPPAVSVDTLIKRLNACMDVDAAGIVMTDPDVDGLNAEDASKLMAAYRAKFGGE